MNNKKAASEIVGFLAITLIAIVITGGAFFWAIQLVENNQKASRLYYSEELMVRLSEIVEEVLEGKTQQNIRIKLEDSQTIYIKNDSIKLSNRDGFSSTNLAGNKYLRGNENLCSQDNVSVGEENICVVERLLNEFEFYYVKTYSSAESKLYSLEFEIENVGSATKVTYVINFEYNGFEEIGNEVINKIKIDIK